MAEYDYGNGRSYPHPQAAFDACQEANETGANGPVTFTGTGLDDLSTTHPPDAGSPIRNFRVEIDATGSPDTFKWSKDGGSTWEATGIEITGSDQVLTEGVAIRFTNTTGHTLGDRWDWTTQFTSQDFAETNAVRGYGGAIHHGYAAGEPVLRLAHSVTGRGVKPTQEHRLLINRNGNDQVDFMDDQDAGCIVGGKSDGTNLASHVTIDLPGIHSTQTATGKGILVCPDRTGGETARDWVFRNIQLYASQYGLVVGCLHSARLEAVQFRGFGSGAAIYADGPSGSYGYFTGGLALLNCTGRAEGPVMDVTGDVSLWLVHCSLYSQDNVVRLLTLNNTIVLCLINNILYTAGDSKSCLSTDLPELRVLQANGNCYYYPGAGASLLDLNGTDVDYAGWKSIYGQDANSLEADPLLTDPAQGDFTFQSLSPCRMRGRAPVAYGLEGNERALSIDIGAYQPSLPANWSLNNRAGEITARIEGRIKVQGL